MKLLTALTAAYVSDTFDTHATGVLPTVRRGTLYTAVKHLTDSAAAIAAVSTLPIHLQLKCFSYSVEWMHLFLHKQC